MTMPQRDAKGRFVAGGVAFEVVADSRKFRSGLAKARADLSRFAVLAGGAAAAALGSLGLSATKAASDAEEVASKFDVVFSGVAAGARAAAKDLGDSYDLSGMAAQQLLGNTGDLLTGFGFSQQAALDLSRQVQTLAADLASFNNLRGGAAEASRALTTSLTGERESLKRLGIVVNETTPEWKAMLAEIEATTGAVGSQAKALATLRMAQEQSKNAIGDYARTQGSLANQTRALEADIHDLRVEIGKELIPVALQGVKSMREFAESLTRNDFQGLTQILDEVKDRLAGVVTGFKVLGDIGGLVGATVAAIAAELAGAEESSIGMQEAMRQALDNLTGDGIARTYHEVRSAIEAATKPAEDLANSAKAQAQGATAVTKEMERQKRIREGTFQQVNLAQVGFGSGRAGRAAAMLGRPAVASAAAAAAGAYVPETGMLAPKAGQAEALAELARLREADGAGVRRRASNAMIAGAGGFLHPNGFGSSVDMSLGDRRAGISGRASREQTVKDTQVARLLERLIEEVRRNGGTVRLK